MKKVAKHSLNTIIVELLYVILNILFTLSHFEHASKITMNIIPSLAVSKKSK